MEVPLGMRSRLQIARALLFIVLHSLLLGALSGAVILGVKAIVEPPLAMYVGMPLVFGLIFVYGKWVWEPQWKQRARKQWT